MRGYPLAAAPVTPGGGRMKPYLIALSGLSIGCALAYAIVKSGVLR